MEYDKIVLEIEKSINENHSILTSMGVLNGLAGVSLFYYYIENYERSLYFLENAIIGLNQDYRGNDIIADIIEIGILLDFYVKEELVKREEVESYFDNYDLILQELFLENLEYDILSPANGVLRYGNYFLKRAKKFKGKVDIFPLIIDKIEKLAKYDENTGGIYWVSNIERDGQYFIELGIKHGIIGIVDFLVGVYDLGIEKERTIELIKKALKYVISSKLTKKTFLFPFCTDDVNEAHSFSFGLNYGDLGIAYGFYRAVKICRLEEYNDLVIEILENASNFKDDEKKYIRDANLLYGTLGVSSIFKKFNNEFKEKFLYDSMEYWYLKTKEYKNDNNRWAGFDTTFNKFDINAQLSMSHGIIGIGIALVNFDKDFDFLSFFGYNF